MAGQGVQQGVALRGAVKLVVQPEVLNVDGRDAPLFGFVCVQKVLQMLQEVLLACNGCKGTRLYCADGCIFLSDMVIPRSPAKIASFRHSLSSYALM